MSSRWRILDSGQSDASFNMALDEAIALSVRRSESPPTLRFYGWTCQALTLGSFQKSSSIDRKFCSSEKIPVIRRPTGGRAILHGDELTYSISARTDREPFSKGLMESYRIIGTALSHAFRLTGIMAESRKDRERGPVLSGSPLCFDSSSYGEIIVRSRKLVGSAQKRWRDGLLQQGSMPFSDNGEKMKRIFGLLDTPNAGETYPGLREILPSISFDKLKQNISLAFEEILGISLLISHPTDSELQLAQELEQQKYLQDSWNFRL